MGFKLLDQLVRDSICIDFECHTTCDVLWHTQPYKYPDKGLVLQVWSAICLSKESSKEIPDVPPQSPNELKKALRLVETFCLPWGHVKATLELVNRMLAHCFNLAATGEAVLKIEASGLVENMVPLVLVLVVFKLLLVDEQVARHLLIGDSFNKQSVILLHTLRYFWASQDEDDSIEALPAISCKSDQFSKRHGWVHFTCVSFRKPDCINEFDIIPTNIPAMRLLELKSGPNSRVADHVVGPAEHIHYVCLPNTCFTNQ